MSIFKIATDCYNSFKISLNIWVILSFVISFVLAPFSVGIVYFFLYVYAYEVALFVWNRKNVITNRKTVIYYIFTRLSIVFASILGWFLGRLVIRENDPFQQGYDMWDWIKFSI